MRRKDHFFLLLFYKSVTIRRRRDLVLFRSSIVCEIAGDGGETIVAVVYRSPNADMSENETFSLKVNKTVPVTL